MIKLLSTQECLDFISSDSILDRYIDNIVHIGIEKYFSDAISVLIELIEHKRVYIIIMLQSNDSGAAAKRQDNFIKNWYLDYYVNSMHEHRYIEIQVLDVS